MELGGNMDINELNSEAENFKKEFEANFEESREDYKKFLSLYPYKEHPEMIDSIIPESIYNPGEKPYFLYCIEFGLKEFGAIRVGTAKYAENARNNLNLFKKLLKIVVDDSFSISEKVDAPWEDIKYFSGDKNIAKKIIFCYNHTKILPIYKTEHLEHFASLINEDFNSNINKFNKPYENLSLGEKFEYLNDIILKFKEEEIEVEMDNVCFMHFLYNFLYPSKYKNSGNEPEKKLEDSSKSKDIIKPRIWKITPGNYEKRNQIWGTLKERGYIGVGWFGCPQFIKMDYSKFESLQEVKDKFAEWYPAGAGINSSMIWNFGKVISEGDIVVANSGYKGIWGIGLIQNGYIGPEEAEKLKIDPDEEYFHFRKVNWLITDELNMDEENFFDRKTVTELKEIKWNKIKEAYIKKSAHYKGIFEFMENQKKQDSNGIEIIKKLFHEFQENYLTTPEGIKHHEGYEKERQEVEKYYNEIKINPNLIYDTSKSIINYLLPIKRFAVAPAGFKDIKAVRRSDENLPEFTEAVYDLITDLKETSDKNVQKELINSFKTGQYGKGIQTAILSSALFYLDPNYLLINTKTVNTFNFLSEVIGDNEKINGNITDYIDNLEKLSKLLKHLSEYVPKFSDFEVFDAFCHWMCDKNLGYYAIDADKFERWLEEPFESKRNSDYHYQDVCLYPETIETNILTKKKIFNQLCGTLNSGKHVMLTGAPGTGKTNLAEDICQVAENLNFTDGSILTTATSDWTTFDTIGGYLPDENGRLVFEEGTFLKSIKENKWLIIDEINRADIDKAFGQLFTVLSGQGVTLPYKCNGKSVEIKRTNENRSYYDSETSTYYVGNNWRILATMNVYDKDYLFEMSYAFMRRFTFIYIDLPDDEDFKYLINSWGNGSTEDYLPKIHELLKINPYRQIGPAIFKDLVEYVTERDKIGTTDLILEDAVLSYILPQFEGLEKAQILDIWKILKDTFEDPEEIRVRLEEISTVKLDES